MGAMALLRQVYNDADWYAKGNMKNKDLALEALNGNKDLIQIFETDNVLDRFYMCAKKYELDVIVRITADCPLIDPNIVNLAIKINFINE